MENLEFGQSVFGRLPYSFGAFKLFLKTAVGKKYTKQIIPILCVLSKRILSLFPHELSKRGTSYESIAG